MSRALQRLLSCACALGLAFAASCSAGDPRPNVILITVDTLRADHMSVYGYERATTPALERWARGGTVFDRASSASSWTLPSMATIYTGQVRIKTSGKVWPEQRNIAEYFAAHGYRTGAVIAHGAIDRDNGYDQGFQDFNGYEREVDGQEVPEWVADQVTAMGREWIESVDGPFFLALHYMDPHNPYAPVDGLAFEPYDDPERRAAFVQAAAPEHRELFGDEIYAQIERNIALYDSEILQTDRSLGELFDWLDRRGLSDNTLIVLSADHGEGLWQRASNKGEKLRPERLFPELYQFHGSQLYREQVHVPLLLAGPGVPQGLRVGAHVSMVDLLPTILTLVRIPLPEDLHGRALPFDPDATQPAPVFSHCSRGSTVTIEGRWRLHMPRPYRIEKFGAESELYDIAVDPLERQPVQDPELIRDLEGTIAAWLDYYEALEDGRVVTDDFESQRKKLAAMGYVWDELVEPPAEDDEHSPER